MEKKLKMETQHRKIYGMLQKQLWEESLQPLMHKKMKGLK